MPAKVKIVRARDFLQTTQEGMFDLAASRQMLADVAAVSRPPVDYHLLLDLRRVQWMLSTADIYELAITLVQQENLRRSKIAVLVLPGGDFDAAQFLETCSVNRGMNVDAFTNFEDAIHWFFAEEAEPDRHVD